MVREERIVLGSTCLLVGGALAASAVVGLAATGCGSAGGGAVWAVVVAPLLCILCGVLFVIALRRRLRPAVWGWVLVAAIFGPMLVLAVLAGTAEVCNSQAVEPGPRLGTSVAADLASHVR
jgi:hypothetical protein